MKNQVDYEDASKDFESLELSGITDISHGKWAVY